MGQHLLTVLVVEMVIFLICGMQRLTIKQLHGIELLIGTYRVLVSDMNSCIDSADVTVFEPSPLTIYTSNDN